MPLPCGVSHDAEYVALAQILGCRLVTLDGPLIRPRLRVTCRSCDWNVFCGAPSSCRAFSCGAWVI